MNLPSMKLSYFIHKVAKPRVSLNPFLIGLGKAGSSLHKDVV